ncbi:tRNA-uridine aminocarboxypropyltransferase [Marinibactrum halimedae]|uniref:tRNA-uridine aminocarboxypropyltransferase n=1 Tax=Marinibactrum halimedae TaxID=1444977 RepID=A0AA37WMM2_9GAMM|nr:tRNA-uridine aminocarboxypropyltransferase [Marinibactrum halimedae]MCD9461198.1 DTW domain-containing protein [Marinibactrum halimedae]GLS26420.1 DTW domain-containing protein [Marinibactrum halimedae]
MSRPICTRCYRPQRTCICSLVVEHPCDVEVIIWQHPSEQHHPKGTAQLLHLCLPNSRLIVTEIADCDDLKLSDKALLLYPNTHNDDVNINTVNDVNINTVNKDDKKHNPVSADPHSSEPPRQLLVLDGTWRKSRKLMHLNPWLHTLPRLALTTPTGEYKIRKAHFDQQLSTFEAVAHALTSLTSDAFDERLLPIFRAFIQAQDAFRPPHR